MEQAYTDIIVLAELYRDIIENKIGNCDKLEFAREGLMDEAKELGFYERNLATLLRSIYFMASSFINILLYNCNYRTIDEKPVSLTKIYTNKKNNINKDEVELTNLFQYADKAYLVQVFRNICVAHFDNPRTFSVVSQVPTGTTVTCRLNSQKLYSQPLINVCREYDTDIIELSNKYNISCDYKIPSSSNVCNVVNIISDLFYKVPLVKDGKKNISERDKLYKIIQCKACYSMTCTEIVDSVDKLIRGLCMQYEF